MKFITLNSNGNKVLKSIPTKTIVFQFFEVSDKIKDLIIRCPYNGKIVKISASTNNIGTVDTQLIVEKISKGDFKNQLDTWSSVLSSNLFIRTEQVVDDGSYLVGSDIVSIGDYFRVNLIGASDLKGLNLEIEIEVI